MRALERTGRTVTISGLQQLQPGRAYVVNQNNGVISLEELDEIAVLPRMGVTRINGLVIDPDKRTIIVDHSLEDRHLTRTGWRLLLHLLNNSWRVVPFDELLEVLGYESLERKTLRVWIARLRKQLPELPLVNVVGQGYRIQEPAK
jgi:DNA-binding response OmpR family regulator